MPTSQHKEREGQSAKERALLLVHQHGILRARDLAAHRLPGEVLRRLWAEGKLERRGRGLYVLAGADLSEHEMLATAAARVPHGVVCLLSALRFHELTTQNPAEVWLAIDRKARAPREPELPLRIVRFSGGARTAGIEQHQIDGVQVPIYAPAKTVADCFKYRNKIGLDLAIEALRAYHATTTYSVDELWRYATICRVTNTIRPYLEALS